ncbi:MAG: NFACT family protein [Treponema sp.]|nr:NFACT family protein [Treponema sp.]
MSLNWKEINLILEELDLSGSQIQKAVQSAFDVLFLKLYGKDGAKNLLISLSPGACRVHQAFDSAPKSDRPLRFAQFLNSRITNARIEEAVQLGSDRIVRLTVRRDRERYFLYLRLWSNAANVIVADADGNILDAMRRLPKKGEFSGGRYVPEYAEETGAGAGKPGKDYRIREFSEELRADLSPDASFNEKIDALYRMEGGALSLDALREEVRRKFEGSIDRIRVSVEKLKEKEADFLQAERLRECGDLILANLGGIKVNAQWLEAENFYAPGGGTVRIKLDPRKAPAACAEEYYEQYRKAKSGLAEIQASIEEGDRECARLREALKALLSETNPLVLHKRLRSGGSGGKASGLSGKIPARREDAKRPGLSFRRKDWLIIVGRDVAENDALLRKHVKGNDLWIHARDFPGSYVFIKQKPGKTIPLDILLDAGNLALFYSKGRNNGSGDLFYTPVKYLRRAKNAPKGLVIPTQEKNLHIKIESARLRDLEECRLEK